MASLSRFSAAVVAPFTGAWIEISEPTRIPCVRTRSLPSRERGLKSYSLDAVGVHGVVALFTGAWIEISAIALANWFPYVAPFTGAWIEIRTYPGCSLVLTRSLPSRERGLKFLQVGVAVESGYVAPFTGAWIEILRSVNMDMDWMVAPFTGAWIEIPSRSTTSTTT